MTTRVETAWNEIRLAREYTLRLIDGLPESDWFRMPSAGVSHIGWQLGHLAMAQYRLVLDRLRGERPEDAELIAPELLVKFGKGSTPEVDASGYPSPQEILAMLGRVYAQSERELATFPDVDLDSPPLKPHPLFNTKLGSLFWCCRHEMLHAGQIGLLRRQLGHAAKW